MWLLDFDFDERALFTSTDMQVEVLPSLQKPKKITACGSDGKAYVLLCKPKVWGHPFIVDYLSV